MKPLLSTVNRLVLCLALTTGISACGGDEDSSETPVADAGSEAGPDAGQNSKNPNENSPDAGENTDGGDNGPVDPLAKCTVVDANTSLTDFVEGCYRVTAAINLDLDMAGTVTFQPGAILYFENDAQLQIWADKVEAIGTESAPIKFLNAPNKTWKGITLISTHTTFKHVVIEGVNAEANDALEIVNGGPETIDLQYVTFQNNDSRDCLYFDPYFTKFTLEHVKFGCRLGSVEVDLTSVDKLSDTLDFNGLPIVARAGDQRSAITVRKVPNGYIVHGGMSFKDAVTFEPGVVLTVDSKDAIEFIRSHTLTGTADEPIIIRAGEGEKWAGVLVNGPNSVGSYDYVHLVGAGTSTVRDDNPTNIRVTSSGRATLRNCELRDSTGYAGIKDPSGTFAANNTNKYTGNKYNEIRGL